MGLKIPGSLHWNDITRVKMPVVFANRGWSVTSELFKKFKPRVLPVQKREMYTAGHCSALKAFLAGKGPTKGMYSHPCNSACCAYCGRDLVRVALRCPSMELEGLRGYVLPVLLTYPKIERHSKNAPYFVAFIGDATLLLKRLRKRPNLGTAIAGGLLVTHFNMFRGSPDVVQPHIHLWLIIEPKRRMKAVAMIEEMVRGRGFTVKADYPLDDEPLSLFANYAKNNHIFQARTHISPVIKPTDRETTERGKAKYAQERELWGRLVIRQVQWRLRRPCFVAGTFGALYGKEFSTLQHRAMYELDRHRRERGWRPKKIPPPLPRAFTNVPPVRRCLYHPICKGEHEDITLHAKQRGKLPRYWCTKCEKTSQFHLKYAALIGATSGFRTSEKKLQLIKKHLKLHRSHRFTSEAVGVNRRTVSKVAKALLPLQKKNAQ